MAQKARKSSKKRLSKTTDNKKAKLPRYLLWEDPIGRIMAWIAGIIAILPGILLSFKHLSEPDLWWIFRTGEWIWQNGHPPFQDTFSYTMHGNEWINVKWGFELLAYGIQQMAGPEFIYCLQAIVVAAFLGIIYGVYGIWNKEYLGIRTVVPLAGLIVAIYLGLMAIEFRINGRPEMISHLFVVLYAFILINYYSNPSRQIFWLIPLQIVWTNFHEAYGTGIVMLGAFSAGCWAEYWLYMRNIPDLKLNFRPWYLTLTTGLAILAMAVNPRGFELILHPLNIYNQLGANQFTTELFPCTHPNYWQFQGKLNLFFAFLAFGGLFFQFRTSNLNPQKWYLFPIRNVGIGYLLFLGMFFYLSLTAYRNIPFFILISLPWVGIVLDKLFAGIRNKLPLVNKRPALLTRSGYVLLILGGLGAYAAVASNQYYEQFQRDETFGLQVDATKNPADAADFIKEHEIEGRCLSDYLTSSYLMWDLRPGFKTFIDLRDLDVYPVDFFNRFAQMMRYPKVFKQADSLYQFDYVTLYRSEFQNLHKFLFQTGDYKAVYADPVAVVYLKNDSTNKELIREHGFIKGKHDIFRVNNVIEPSNASRVLTKMFWPFYEVKDYHSVNFDAIASQFYQSIGAMDMAYNRAKKALKNQASQANGHVAMGNLMLTYSEKAKDQESVEKYYRRAYRQFQKAYELDPNNVFALTSLGLLEIQYGNYEKAETYLSRSVKVDALNVDGYRYLARVYQSKAQKYPQNQQSHLETRIDYLQKAKKVGEDDPMLNLELGVAYCKLDRCQNAAPLLREFRKKGKVRKLGKGNLQAFEKCADKCL